MRRLSDIKVKFQRRIKSLNFTTQKSKKICDFIFKSVRLVIRLVELKLKPLMSD